MLPTPRQLTTWRKYLQRILREMEAVSGERAPTKAENLVQYASEEVENELRQVRERI